MNQTKSKSGLNIQKWIKSFPKEPKNNSKEKKFHTKRREEKTTTGGRWKNIFLLSFSYFLCHIFTAVIFHNKNKVNIQNKFFKNDKKNENKFAIKKCFIFVNHTKDDRRREFIEQQKQNVFGACKK